MLGYSETSKAFRIFDAETKKNNNLYQNEVLYLNSLISKQNTKTI